MKISKTALAGRILSGMLVVTFVATTLVGTTMGQGSAEKTKKWKVRTSMSPSARKAEKEDARLGNPRSEKKKVGGKQIAHPGKPAPSSKLAEAFLGFDPVPRGESFLDNLKKGERAPTAKEIAGLPTIEEALGLPTRNQETVFGTDNRSQVTSTNRFPWSVNCLLIIELQDGSRKRGTGFLIGNRAVMTAGHCVHTGGRRGQWAKRIWVYPGYSAGKKPFGVFSSTRLYSNSVWTGRNSTRYDPKYDYGCIMLSSNVGRRTGYYGFANYSASTLRGMKVNSAGYPSDKPNYTMCWYGPISRVYTQLVQYRMDQVGGQSGSAIYRKTRRGRYVVAILVAENSSWNSGQRVNSGVYKFMNSMRYKR